MIDLQMRGLTLHRPWERTFLDLGKDVENRVWKPPTKMVGHLIALHAGNRFSTDAVNWIAERFDRVYTPEESVAGRIVAVCELTGYVEQSNSRWFFGPFGWTFKNLRAIEPVECAGALGLWRLPLDVERIVRSRYNRAL